jgi:hypothetical protein
MGLSFVESLEEMCAIFAITFRGFSDGGMTLKLWIIRKSI